MQVVFAAESVVIIGLRVMVQRRDAAGDDAPYRRLRVKPFRAGVAEIAMLVQHAVIGTETAFARLTVEAPLEAIVVGSHGGILRGSHFGWAPVVDKAVDRTAMHCGGMMGIDSLPEHFPSAWYEIAQVEVVVGAPPAPTLHLGLVVGRQPAYEIPPCSYFQHRPGFSAIFRPGRHNQFHVPEIAAREGTQVRKVGNRAPVDIYFRGAATYHRHPIAVSFQHRQLSQHIKRAAQVGERRTGDGRHQRCSDQPRHLLVGRDNNLVKFMHKRIGRLILLAESSSCGHRRQEKNQGS